MAKKKVEKKDLFIAPAIKGASKAGWHNISTFLKCPKEYQMSMIRGISVPRTLLPDPLAIGQLFHEGRAHWFNSGFPTGAEYWGKLKTYINASADTSNPPIRPDAVTRTLSYLEQYCSHWAMRAKPTVVGVEYEIEAPLRKDDPLYLHRTARLDDVSQYPEANGKLCIGECKTTSVGIDDAVNEYTLHGQPMLQYLLWQMSKKGHAKHGKKYGPLEYVLLDVIVKGYGKERCKFGRQAVPISQHSLNWYIQSMRGYLNAASLIDYDTTVPRNISSCTRLSGRARVPCQFRDLCQFGRSAAPRYVDKEGDGLSNPKYNSYPVKPWE
jgi:hypothetical protein